MEASPGCWPFCFSKKPVTAQSLAATRTKSEVLRTEWADEQTTRQDYVHTPSLFDDIHGTAGGIPIRNISNPKRSNSNGEGTELSEVGDAATGAGRAAAKELVLSLPYALPAETSMQPPSRASSHLLESEPTPLPHPVLERSPEHDNSNDVSGQPGVLKAAPKPHPSPIHAEFVADFSAKLRGLVYAVSLILLNHPS